MGKYRIPRTSSGRQRLVRYRRSLRPQTSAPSASNRRRRLERGLLGFVSVSLILGGLHTLISGGIGYRNYWGGTIFAPFAIGIGVVLLLLTIFAWPRLKSSPLLAPGEAPTDRHSVSHSERQ